MYVLLRCKNPASHYHDLDSLLSGLMLVRLFRVDQILWGRRKLCLADDIPITDEFKENTMDSTGMSRVQNSTRSVSSSYLLIHNWYATLNLFNAVVCLVYAHNPGTTLPRQARKILLSTNHSPPFPGALQFPLPFLTALRFLSRSLSSIQSSNSPSAKSPFVPPVLPLSAAAALSCRRPRP